MVVVVIVDTMTVHLSNALVVRVIMDRPGVHFGTLLLVIVSSLVVVGSLMVTVMSLSAVVHIFLMDVDVSVNLMQLAIERNHLIGHIGVLDSVLGLGLDLMEE